MIAWIHIWRRIEIFKRILFGVMCWGHNVSSWDWVAVGASNVWPHLKVKNECFLTSNHQQVRTSLLILISKNVRALPFFIRLQRYWHRFFHEIIKHQQTYLWMHFYLFLWLTVIYTFGAVFICCSHFIWATTWHVFSTFLFNKFTNLTRY